MNKAYEYMTTLEYLLKNAEQTIAAFKSGDKYVQLQAEAAKNLRYVESLNRKLKEELYASRRETKQMRNHWYQLCDKLEKKCSKIEKKLNRIIEDLIKKVYKTEHERDNALGQITEWRRKYYDIASELEEERGKNQMLTAQLNRDYENSSIPSSKSKNHKKITNSREKTERKPGAQPGHAHHGRKNRLLQSLRWNLFHPKKYCRILTLNQPEDF